MSGNVLKCMAEMDDVQCTVLCKILRWKVYLCVGKEGKFTHVILIGLMYLLK